MAKITLQPGKTYTYTGNLNKYTVVVGEIIDGGIVTPGSELPTLRYGSGPPSSDLGRVGDVYIDTANSILYTRSSSGWDAGVAFRGADGADGNPGVAGIDGTSPLFGYLTSDSHIVTGDNQGIIEDDLTDVDTQYIVYRGDTAVSGLTFKASADGVTFVGPDTFSVHPSGVKAKISSGGIISFAKDAWGTTSVYDTLTFYFQASIGSVALVKSFKLIRTRGGKDAKSIRLSSSRTSFTKNSIGEFDPAGQSVKFIANIQNYPPGSTPTWKLEVEDSSSPTGWTEVADGLNVAVANDEATLTQASFVSALGSAKVVKVTAMAPVADIDLDGNNDAALSDSISISAVSDGLDGQDGISPINAVLTNETHSVVANELGEVTEVMEGAGGYFQVYFGGDAVTDAKFSIMNGTTEIDAVDGDPAEFTKDGVKLTLESTGRYFAEESGPGWIESGPDVITFTLRASEINDLFIDKVFTLNRVKGGANAKIIYLTTDRQNFKHDSSGNPSPTEQTIVLSAQRQNLETAVTWSFETLYNGTWVPKNDLVAGTNYGTPSTTGSTDQVELTYAQYDDLLEVTLGKGDVLKVKATVGSVYDEVSIITVADGEKGEQGAEGRKTITTDQIPLESVPDPTQAYGTLTGDILIDVINHKMYLRGAGSWTLQGTSFRGLDGVGGAAMSAVLSNEVHTVGSDDLGYVDNDVLDGAGGQMYVYYGPVLLGPSVNYADIEYYTSADGGTTWVPANVEAESSGLRFSIGENGVYNVSSDSVDEATGISSWTHTVGTVTVKFKAVVTSTEDQSPLDSPTSGVDIITTEVVKSYTITKAKGGASAKIVTLTSDSMIFKKGADGSYAPSAQSIDFTTVRQNLDDATFKWYAYKLGASNWELVWNSDSPGASPKLTVATNTLSASMDLAQFDAIISGSSDATAKVRVEFNAETFDETSIIVAADGASPISGLLTNESHTAVADEFGNITDMNDPGGDFKVYEGGSELTSGVTFYVINDSGNIANTYTNADGLTAAIDNTTGVYTITESAGKWNKTSTAASFRFRAVKAAGTAQAVSVDKVYSITKALGGANARYVRLSCDRNNFVFTAANAAVDSSAVANFTAETKNYASGTYPVTWEVFAGGVKKTPLSTYLTVGSPNDRQATMSVTQFSNATSGGSTEVTVKSHVSGSGDVLSGEDSVTVVRTKNGADGSTPINGYLTNESVTIIAENDGSLTADKLVSLAVSAGTTYQRVIDGTQGSFNVQVGTLPLPTSDVDFFIDTGNVGTPSGSIFGDYRVWSQSGVAMFIHADNGSYFVTASSQAGWTTDGLNFTLVATGTTSTWGSSGPFKKVFSLGKSKGGASAKLVTVTSDYGSFTKNSAGAFNPLTITWTASLKNIAETPAWTLYKIAADGTETTVPNSNYTVADTGGGNHTLKLSSSFAAVSSSIPNFKVKATAGGLSDSWSVGVVGDGADGISGMLSNEVHSVSVGDNGAYNENDLSSGNGVFTVLKGGTNKTADGSYRFSLKSGSQGEQPTFDNTAKTWTLKLLSNLTMSIHNTSGTYSVTSSDGESAGRWKTNAATFTLFASASNGTGDRLEKVYSISKTANKFISITQPGAVLVDAAGQTAVGAGAISSIATLTGCSGSAPNWSLEKRENSSSTWDPVVSPVWTISGNTMSMSYSQFITNRGGSAKPDAALRVTAKADFGISDSQEITSVRQGPSGAKGDTGLKGDTGTTGTNAKLISLAASAPCFTQDGTGAYSPASQTITFTPTLQNLNSSTVTWTLARGDGTAVTRDSTTLTTSTSPLKATMTQAQFNTASGGILGEKVVVTATCDGVSATFAVYASRNGADGQDLPAWVASMGSSTASYDIVPTEGNATGSGKRLYMGDIKYDVGGLVSNFETNRTGGAAGIYELTGYNWLQIPSAGTYQVKLQLAVRIENWNSSYTRTCTFYGGILKAAYNSNSDSLKFYHVKSDTTTITCARRGNSSSVTYYNKGGTAGSTTIFSIQPANQQPYPQKAYGVLQVNTTVVCNANDFIQVYAARDAQVVQNLTYTGIGGSVNSYAEAAFYVNSLGAGDTANYDNQDSYIEITKIS